MVEKNMIGQAGVRGYEAANYSCEASAWEGRELGGVKAPPVPPGSTALAWVHLSEGLHSWWAWAGEKTDTDSGNNSNWQQQLISKDLQIHALIGMKSHISLLVLQMGE